MEEDDNRLTIGMVFFSFPNLLTIVFLVLKLFSVINWSWFFVFLPSIISVVLVVIFIFYIIFSSFNRTVD